MNRFKLNYEAYFKRLIILGWVALAICTVIKLAGGNYFTIGLEEGTFKDVCTYIDNQLWANYIVRVLYSLVSFRFFLLSVIGKKTLNKLERILSLFTILIGVAFKFWSYEWGFLFDVWQMILLPAILLIKTPKKFVNIFYGNVALIVFQIVSMFTKGALPDEIYNTALVGMLYSIDVIIMTIIYYAYANSINLKKEVSQNV